LHAIDRTTGIEATGQSAGEVIVRC
jgi:hypothetical protein